MNLLLVLKIPKNIDVATNAFKKQMEGGLVKVCTEAIKRKREGEIGISRKRRKRYTKVGDVAVHVSLWASSNGVARTLKKLRTQKGHYSIKQRFSSFASLFKMGTSLIGKNLLPEGANTFLYEQFLIVWKSPLSH